MLMLLPLLPLFSDVDPTSTIIGALFGGIPGTLVALVAIMKTRQEGVRTTRKDTIGEYEIITNKLQEQVDELKGEVKEQHKINEDNSTKMFSLITDLSNSKLAEAKCQLRVSQLESDVKLLSSDLRRMQEQSHDLPPGVTRPAVIITDSVGKILNASAEVGSMFNWLPTELIGNNIEELMPKELKPIHRRAMEKMVTEKRHPDPDKPVLSYGLTKTGVKFPIMINLSGWNGVDGTSYLTAEIRRRGDSAPFPLVKKD